MLTLDGVGYVAWAVIGVLFIMSVISIAIMG